MNRLIIVLIAIILIAPTMKGQEKVDYRFELKPGIETIAITNRTFDIKDGLYYFNNSIDTNRTLAFFHSEHIGDFEIKLKKLSYEEIERYISKKTGKWLLFVHGDFKTFELAVLRAMDIGETYGINVMVFCWPSKDPDISGTRNFKNSKANVYKSEKDFMELLEIFRDFDKNDILGRDSLSAFFHSLGNLYLKNYTECIHPRQKAFSNLIMNSAAVEQEDHNHWVENLEIQERVYILFNKHDFTLNGLRIFTPAGKQLGERIKDTLADNAIYLDFSSVVGHEFPTWNSHSFYIGDMPVEYPHVGEVYWNLFNSKELDLLDTNIYRKTDYNNRYIIEH